jgi:hypothetical protein
MKAVRTLDREKAPFAWVAVQDARMRSLANASLYTDAQKLKAERIKLALELVYKTKGAYINYRKKFIVIKLDDATVVDKKGLKFLEDGWDDTVVKVPTPQGIIYRVT